ncbi:MAG: putative hydro-lyase [Pseudomonadota bacterium]
MTPQEARAAIAKGAITGPTAGLAPGALQANLVILPAAEADAFARFCAKNPKPCPLLARSAPGRPHLPPLGATIDVRHDLPGYRVWRDGAPIDTVTDIGALWRDDLVAFALGCSFGFEAALMDAGINLRHIALQQNVSMYDTSLSLAPEPPFAGHMVVSMRPIREGDVSKVVALCEGFPLCHGTPVHVGDPAAIGINDLSAPDYGDPTPMEPGEVPVFWACGVTPQNVIRASGTAFAITHAPGRMLICDCPAGITEIAP